MLRQINLGETFRGVQGTILLLVNITEWNEWMNGPMQVRAQVRVPSLP